MTNSVPLSLSASRAVRILKCFCRNWISMLGCVGDIYLLALSRSYLQFAWNLWHSSWLSCSSAWIAELEFPYPTYIVNLVEAKHAPVAHLCSDLGHKRALECGLFGAIWEFRYGMVIVVQGGSSCKKKKNLSNRRSGDKTVSINSLSHHFCLFYFFVLGS